MISQPKKFPIMISLMRMSDNLSENNSLHDEPKSFYEHLAELRGCIVHCVAALLICTIAAFPFQKLWLKILVYPGSRSLKTLTWLNPPDIFVLRIKLSILFGLLIALPYIIRHIWLFVAPALHQHERKWISRLSGISFVLFWTGVMFAYWIMVPLAMKFFMSFGSDFLVPNITMPHYIGFTTFLLLAAGCAFQIPIILVFLMRIGAVPRKKLEKNRGIVLIIILLVSAFFTPPDAFTMILMAAPLYSLFEVSLLMDKILDKTKKSNNK